MTYFSKFSVQFSGNLMTLFFVCDCCCSIDVIFTFHFSESGKCTTCTWQHLLFISYHQLSSAVNEAVHICVYGCSVVCACVYILWWCARVYFCVCVVWCGVLCVCGVLWYICDFQVYLRCDVYTHLCFLLLHTGRKNGENDKSYDTLDLPKRTEPTKGTSSPPPPSLSFFLAPPWNWRSMYLPETITAGSTASGVCSQQTRSPPTMRLFW